MNRKEGRDKMVTPGGDLSGCIEKFDYRSSQASEIVKRGNNARSLRSQSFIKRYQEMNLCFGIRCGFGDYAKFGFVIHARESVYGSYCHTPGRVPADSEFTNDWAETEQISMLPLNVQLMQENEGFIPVTSTVRFEIFEDNLYGTGKPLYEFSPAEISPIEIALVRGDGKVDFVWPRYAVATRQRTDKNVQTTPYGVDKKSEFDAETQRRRSFLDRHKGIISGIRVAIFPDNFNVVFDPSVHACLKGWEVGYGPVNACNSF